MFRFRSRVWPALVLTAVVATAGAEEIADCDRDWSGVRLAWRGDPRPPSDTPGGIERPLTRRQARRARRAAARGRHHPPNAAEPLRPNTAEPLTLAIPSPAVEPAAIGRVVHRDIPYVPGGHSRQRLDLYLPEASGGGPVPLVVWIHGNAWQDGTKGDCPLTWLVDRGYAVASIGYRLTDAAVFPAQLEDCLAAVGHLEDHADAWNIDASRIAVVGTAAGGHLAALVGLDDDVENRAKLAAVCVVAAPTLLTTLGPAQDRPASPASLLVGGPLPEFREAAQRASPLTHVSAEAPPFLILHPRGGDRQPADRAVPVEQSRQFDTALRSVGADSSLVVLDDPQPTGVLCEGSTGAKLLVDFLARHLSGAPANEPAP